MSFLSILKKIGNVAQAALPVVGLAIPGAAPAIGILDNIFGRLQTTILTVEANTPGDGQGGLKAPAVMADFDAGLELTQSILAARGEFLSYDKAALQEAINSQVAAFNAMARVKASFTIVQLEKKG